MMSCEVFSRGIFFYQRDGEIVRGRFRSPNKNRMTPFEAPGKYAHEAADLAAVGKYRNNCRGNQPFLVFHFCI